MEEVNCPECGKHLGYKDTRSTSNSATTTTCSHCGAYIRYWVENGRVEVINNSKSGKWRRKP